MKNSKFTPGPSTKLRLALVLATPGHAGYDPARAATLLREVLDQQPLLTAAETSLATIYLNSVERLSAATSEASRLRTAGVQPPETMHVTFGMRRYRLGKIGRRRADRADDAE